MKNIFSFAIAAFAAALLVSCEPAIIKGPVADEPIGASSLQSAYVVDGQYADAACTVAKEDGNYIKFHTSPARTVQIFNFKSDGSKNILTTGASGVFNITPRRGQDPVQSYSVATINQDGSVVSFDTTIKVYVPADLDPAVKVLTGESGAKAWKWYTIGTACWGNCGYIGVAGQANVAAGEIPGYWWGCVAEDLETEQVQHAGGVAYGYGSSDAYMVFDSVNGTVTSYKADGTQIASSSYSVEDFNWQPDYKFGDLVNDDDASGILFPFVVNKGGLKATNYEIIYLDGTLMTLIYKGDNEEWGWGEATWWRFQPKK